MAKKIINAIIIVLLGAALPALAQLSAQDASNSWAAFNTAFSVSGGHYAWQEGGSFSKNDFWENAEMIEMATDRFLAASDTQDENSVTSLLNGFDSIYGTDWTGDGYNDDIMWAVLAHARAYVALYNWSGTVTSSMTNWLVNASNNFCWVYNGGHSPYRIQPQYDGVFGGGMWWTTNHTASGTKNSCVNGPAALAAFYLGLVYPNAGFMAKGTNMINWENKYLVLPNGFIYDHYATNGAVDGDLSYNAGTYVGAAGFLGLGIPDTVATYFVNNDCKNGILPNNGTGGENDDGFNGIFLRWVGTYEFLSGNTNWESFFNNQASAALAVTNSAGLSWDDWNSNTPSSSLYSWDCSASVVALQYVQIYQNITAPLPETVALTKTSNNQSQLNWIYGTLETATNITGPYNNVPSASSPYTILENNPQQYYRVREN
jgi:predicted alpha-1,6-mannanase (GH76 family)